MAQVNSEDSTAIPPTDPSVEFRRTDISPEDFFKALRRIREAARDEIERLIEWLDSTIDCDADSAADDEPCDGDDFEPSLGSIDRMSDQIRAWKSSGCDLDAELDKSDHESTNDEEPSLGSGAMFEWSSQQNWSHPQGRGCLDGEDDPSDFEPSLCGVEFGAAVGDQDLEANLGSFDRMIDQTKSLRTVEHSHATLGGWPVGDGEIDGYI